MIFVIIIARAAQKSQHNFRFFRPAAADERLLLTREALDPRIPKASPMRGSWLRSEAAQTDEVDCVTQTEAPHLIRHGYRRATFPSYGKA